MTTRRTPAVLALLFTVVAGCSSGTTENADSGTSTTTKTTTGRTEAVRFAECMREHGVAAFPDPDASGELTIDGVANDSSVNPDTAAFKQAAGACKDLQPAGFTGHKRNATEQKTALEFARCVRDNGVKDFPDPTPDGPLIDTNRIPSAAGNGGMSRLNAATKACGHLIADLLRDQ